MGRKLTIGEMVNKIESEGCYLVTDGSHILTTDPIDIECPCGNIYTTTYTIFSSLNKTRCRDCTKKRMADIYRAKDSEIQERITKSGYIFVSIDGEYKNNSCKNITVTDEDGYLYLCSLAEIDKAIREKGGLRIFHKSNKYSINNIVRWIEINQKPFELLSTDYPGAKERSLDFQCLKCGEIWTTKLRDILIGCGCLYCNGKKVGKSNSFGDLYPEYLDDWNYEKNHFSPFEVTPSAHKRTWWKCVVCGNEWKTERPNSVVTNGSKCSVCNPHSSGEGSIIEVLNKTNIEYIKEATFEECFYERVLEFDFYLSYYRACIEFQGHQHFYPVDFGGRGEAWAKSEFKKNQIRDQIKRDFCLQNNIKLIEIPYWEFNNIEEILKNELSI
jgi:hypothetical protein